MASGSIEKRVQRDGTARYRVVVWLPPTGTGKPERKTGTFRTKKEAEAARNEWQASADNGGAVKNTSMIVEELCEAWLTVKRHDLKPRTADGYGDTLARLIVPHIGAMNIQRVQPTTVDTLYALLRSKGRGEPTIHRVHQRLRQLFDYATKRRILAVNPMLAVDAPTVRPAAPTILTASQLRRFLTYAQADGYNPLWLLIVQTGMRRGEALGLRWQDVELAAGKVRVRQSVESFRGVPHITTPKTLAALRTITLFSESVAALKAHRTGQLARRLHAAEWEEHDLVFCTPTGKPLSPDNVYRNFTLIRQRADDAAREAKDEAVILPRFDIHDLRHTHATHLLHEGWPIPTVSRRLGHANPGITMKTYAHALSDVQGEDLPTPTAFAFAGTA